jgi:hypothetical protein
MNIRLSLNYSIELEDCNIDKLIAAFKQLLPLLLTAFVKEVLEQFAVAYMSRSEKPFMCECGNKKDFIWKTKNAKPTNIFTVFAKILLPQMQIQCKACGKKSYITRELLGIVKYQTMSTVTQKMLALIGSLTTFRVSEKITGMFGVVFNRMKVWRCVQKEGKAITFDIDTNELPSGEADGTGIPINGIKKRGRELKVFIQKKKKGGVRIAGLTIGKYDSGWDKLFEPLREAISKFKTFLLVTDGDTSIFKEIKCVNVLLQRCLWHIPHQLKYYLWYDKVERKSDDWMAIMGKVYNIVAIRTQLKDEEIEAVLSEKRRHLNGLISFCRKKRYNSCVSYLLNAKGDMFTSLEKRLNGKSSSLAERVMKTVNMRVNVGKWSESGALNAMKIRLAHYYNDWQPEEIEHRDVEIRRL